LTGLKNESKRVEIFQKLFLYIFNVREIEPTEITNVLSHSKYNREYEDLAMTTAEKLIQKGEMKGKVETAKNMLLDGASLEYVLKITGLTEQELKDYGVI
ncbi:Rpn family recombination-promoting nuclease/putative transposase, partial [Leptospira interrogans]|uniref:Rpn family recombination-promoting nuclease/putative transposase n=1 Tax=Leptospira interrogans TaxID=173 RepID=UPI000B0013F5